MCDLCGQLTFLYTHWFSNSAQLLFLPIRIESKYWQKLMFFFFFFPLPLSCRSGKSWSQSRWYWRSRRRPRNCVSKGSLAKRLVFVLYCYSYWILVPCSSERQQIWSRMETTLRPKFIFWCKELTWILNVCQVQIEVIQKRQKEKKAMMNAVKKYQKGEFI